MNMYLAIKLRRLLKAIGDSLENRVHNLQQNEFFKTYSH